MTRILAHTPTGRCSGWNTANFLPKARVNGPAFDDKMSFSQLVTARRFFPEKPPFLPFAACRRLDSPRSGHAGPRLAVVHVDPMAPRGRTIGIPAGR
jgi:hypothetical protein